MSQPDHATAETPQASKPDVINITGEFVALGPLRRDLAALYDRWINDFATQRSAGFPQRPVPWTAEQTASWVDAATANDHAAWFTVYRIDTWQPIGFTGIRDISFYHRSAEFAITIGEAGERGRGFGTETTSLALDYAFTALGLNRVGLAVFEFNAGGVRAYEKAGFRHIGRARQSHMMGGRLWDVIYMDCLAAEFTSPVLAAVFTPDAAPGHAAR